MREHVLAVALGLLAACGQPTTTQRKSLDPEEHWRAPRDLQRVYVLPEGCLQLGPPPCDTFIVRRSGRAHHLKTRPHALLYLNFEGAHLQAGDDDPVAGKSTVLELQGVAQVDIPPFDTSNYNLPGRLSTRQDAIRAVAGWVAEKFGPFDVKVVTERPPDMVPYTMAVIGGTRGSLQLEEGTLGIAPMDCDDSYKANVVFAFAEELHDLKELAMVVVHEAGHSMGLAHVDQEDAIMYPYSSRDVDWGAGNVPDGQACDGSGYQDSFQVLTQNLGPRPNPKPPWVEFVWPAEQGIYLSTHTVLVQTADDVVVSLVRYTLDGSPIAEKEWPDFSFELPNLEPGQHELVAEAEDAPDNDRKRRTSQASVTFQYDPTCNQSGACSDGLAPVGSPCTDGSQCASGLCAQAPSGTAVCVRPCSDETPCPVYVGLSDTQVLETQCTCSDEAPCCVPKPEDCANGADDDCDGLVDCVDTDDCDGNKACTGMEVCDNSIDDDFDGLTNCDDPDCATDPACGCTPETEDCSNGVDDDCDGLVDCADTQDCHLDQACRSGVQAAKLYCAADEGPVTFLGSSPSGPTSHGDKRLKGCTTAPPAGALWWIGLLLAVAMRRRLHDRRP